MPEWYPKERLGDLPAEAARRWGAREALVLRWQRVGPTANYDREVDRVAKGLIALGVEEGRARRALDEQPVGVALSHLRHRQGSAPCWCRSTPATAPTTWPTPCASPTAAPGSASTAPAPSTTRPCWRTCCRNSRRRTRARPPLRASRSLRRRGRRRARAMCPARWAGRRCSPDGEAVSDAALAARARRRSIPTQPAMIGYTSGTTGHPKGVLHNHVMIRNMRERANRIGLTFEDVIVNPLPLFHMYGFSEAGLIAVIAGCQARAAGPLRRRGVHAAGRGREAAPSPTASTPTTRNTSTRWRGRRATSPPCDFGTFPSGMTSSARIARRVQTEMAPSLHRLGHDRDLHLRHHVLRHLDARAALGCLGLSRARLRHQGRGPRDRARWSPPAKKASS